MSKTPLKTTMLGLCLASLLGLLGCTEGIDPYPVPSDWKLIQQDLDGAILGFWGETKSDVFAVGGTLPDKGGDPGDALILWHDGSSWWRMPIDAPTLWWVHGFTHNDVWAVGEQGTILHFDGSAWTTVTTGAAYTLWGIWGEDPNELWAVGGTVDGKTPSVLLHYDGMDWTEVPDVGMKGELFFKIWGTSAKDIYIVGDGGALVHYNGTSWERQDSGTTARLITVHGSGPDDVYVVGGLNQSVVLHKDETGWSSIYIGTAGGMMGVCATTEQVLITGWFGETAVGRPGNWKVQRQITDDCLHGTWCDGKGNMMAGGGNLISDVREGVIVGYGDIVGGELKQWMGP